MRWLIAIAGPIGAGKSTVAELVARRAAHDGMSAVLVDLDELAFAQRAHLDLDQFWSRAGQAHSALVQAWFEAGTDVVVAHGPFFEAGSYESLFTAAPADAQVVHVLLKVPFDVALQRVLSDGDRGPNALSRDPKFLRSAHDAFELHARTFPAAQLEVDASTMTAAEIAKQVRLTMNPERVRE
jgi:thymidylate kinase